ncbi:MAG: hypothetical protein NTY12_03505 [Candidatus Falkowbacteria bacterium]|nr:hypothetical protein [Candidatus Falkowbacteria bacterium]
MVKGPKIIPDEDQVREIAEKVIDALRSGDLPLDKLKAFYETEVPAIVVKEEERGDVVDFGETEILINYDVDEIDLINSANFKSVAPPFKNASSEERLNGFNPGGLGTGSGETGKKLRRFKVHKSFEDFNNCRGVCRPATLLEYANYAKKMNDIDGLNKGRIMTTGFFKVYDGKDCYPAYSKEEGFISISLLESIDNCMILSVVKDN